MLRLTQYPTPYLDPNMRYFIGLDLGQRRDYTAIAVIECGTESLGRRDPVTMALTLTGPES